ncbi:LysR family transcriptional regulator [Shimia sp.]|uniref:LysR family transcriptional regulator n=1 Tax=Shimia sp. TaxID=1954381 RepID=UPI0035648F0D
MNLSGFDMNLLRVLNALLAEHSTTRAGARIGLSQSAVSAALGRLRHALSDPLFVREGQRLVPTDYARSLERPLRLALENLEDALTGPAAFDPRVSEADFRIAGSDFFASLLVPRLAEVFSREAPQMNIHQIDLGADSFIGLLERTGVDLLLVPEMPFPTWIAHHFMFSSPFVVLARRGNTTLARHALRPGQVVPLDLFCEIGHVLCSPEGKTRGIGDEALEAVGRRRRVAVSLPVFSGVAAVVAQSDLIALVPVQFADHVTGQMALDIYQPPVPVPARNLHMAWHERSTSNPAHRWLRAQVLRATADF